MHRPFAPRRRPAAAFTLMELVVVILVMSILLALTVPRFVGHGRRLHQLAADQVGDLLLMFAQREALSNRPIGIWYDKPRRALVLVVLDIDPRDPEAPPSWHIDRAVAPVKLPPSVDPDRGIMAVADDYQVDITLWPIASEPGKPRPRVEITLITDEGAAKTVVLPANAIAPYQPDDPRLLVVREPIDLDAAGRSREDW